MEKPRYHYKAYVTGEKSPTILKKAKKGNNQEETYNSMRKKSECEKKIQMKMKLHTYDPANLTLR